MPQDLRLAYERGDRALLQGARRLFSHHELDGFFGVPARSRYAGTEVLDRRLVHPRIELLPGDDATRHQIRREELGERRSNGFDQAALAHELHVSVAGESNAGQNAA